MGELRTASHAHYLVGWPKKLGAQRHQPPTINTCSGPASCMTRSWATCSFACLTILRGKRRHCPPSPAHSHKFERCLSSILHTKVTVLAQRARASHVQALHHGAQCCLHGQTPQYLANSSRPVTLPILVSNVASRHSGSISDLLLLNLTQVQ